MDYSEIIRKNCKLASVEWWPRFAFHYTNIANAVSIINMGRLYSRSSAEQLGLMKSDNASRQVIDMTSAGAKQDVRFYFRPLTPTQYYNEGYKHPALRYDNDYFANCPIPIFFVFELKSLLSLPGVTFSEMSRAGNSVTVYSGAEHFSLLNFEMIYASGPMQNSALEKRYRQAEIACPRYINIDSCLTAILCRNAFEQSMLLSLLRKEDYKTYRKYQPFIKVCKENMFEKNGLFVDKCLYQRGKLGIFFANTSTKLNYTRSQKQKKQLTTLAPLNADIIIEWIRSSRKQVNEVIFRNSVTTQIDYEKTTNILLRLPNISGANKIITSLKVENDLLCYAEHALDEESTVL